MVGILIVSHGNLAEALICSVQILVGNLTKVRAISIRPDEGKEEIMVRIRKHLAEVDEGQGVVILTDLLGGTPTNLSLSFLKGENILVVTGVNIPMLLTLASYRQEKSLEQIGRLVKKSGRRSIKLIKNFGPNVKEEKNGERWMKWHARWAIG